MTVLGTLLLVGALLAALAGAWAWWRTARGQSLSRQAAWCGVAALALVLAATLLLQLALLGVVGGSAYVERVTTQGLPGYYRVTAMWSALEGSLLLWLLALAVVAVLGVRSAPVRHRPLVGAVLSAGVAAFAVVTLLASPFGASGGGAPPSPLLQDHVAMGVHPPLLYAGFAAAAVPHALAVAATREGVDGRWVRVVRGWTVLGWVLLTAGIGLGAWWSYAVLGWGGYWAWDPVENASLLPWLTMTALLHALLPGAGAVRRPATAVVLAGVSFVLVLLAQFLTRSGVVMSVHAFTESPLGPVLLALTILGALPWALPLLRRRPHTPGRPGPRRLALLANLVLLTVIAAIVLIGTILPTIIGTLTGQLVAVGAPWYARTLAPVALVLLVLMVVAPWLPGRAGRGTSDLTTRLLPVVACAGVAAGLAGLLIPDPWVVVVAALAGASLATLVVAVVGRKGPRHVGVGIAHLGVTVGAVAVLAGGQGSVREETVPVGGTVFAGPVSATLVDLDRTDEGRRMVAEATVVLGRGEEMIGLAHPSLRWYDSQSTMLAGPAIRTGLTDDVYVTLLGMDADTGTADVRLAHTPLVGWLWASGGLLVLGAAVATLPRRRVTAPARTTDAGAPTLAREAPHTEAVP